LLKTTYFIQLKKTFQFISELFAGHHGPPVSRDGSVRPEQDESSKFVDLFRPRPHARLQPGPTRGQQHLRADPNLKILDRNLAEKPGRTVKQADQWKQQLLKKNKMF
jgi:hypothetical protein